MIVDILVFLSPLKRYDYWWGNGFYFAKTLPYELRMVQTGGVSRIDLHGRFD
ncbi:hypothetical protein HMPREF3204_00202 [Gardnerella pickettii]|nr:hypothetical protein HMPREF3204_00202 [Gardnerella pickettii]